MLLAAGAAGGGFLPVPDEHAVRVPRTDEPGLPPATQIAPVDQRDAVRGESVRERRQAVDVDRQMVKALAAPGEEARDETVRGDGLEQLELPARGPERREIVRAVPTARAWPRHADRDEAPEPGERLVDRAHGECQVVDPEADAIELGDGVGWLIHRRLRRDAGHLPELDEDPRRGAWRDERRDVAVPVVAAPDEAEPRRFECGRVWIEPPLLDLDREMMHALAAAGEEALDEASGPR